MALSVATISVIKIKVIMTIVFKTLVITMKNDTSYNGLFLMTFINILLTHM